MATRNGKGGRVQDKSDNGLEFNPYTRILVLYALSLLLSLMIILISTTVFVVIIYIDSSVTYQFVLLFAGILAANIAVSAISLRGIFRTYPRFYSMSGHGRVIFVQDPASRRGGEATPGSGMLNSRNFTEAELSLVSLLRENSGRVLQSRIAEISGLSRATISRVVTSLENKGVIVRVRKGVTNEIILSETYSR